jgi:Cdc6-like AAA superfamily ATPase
LREEKSALYPRKSWVVWKMKREVFSEPVLVGRDRELEELQAFLNSAIDGKGKTVFVSGEAGSGKTRVSALEDKTFI